jgi:Fe-S cluster assembly protein SufD
MTTATTDLKTDHTRAVADGAHSHGTVKPQGSRAERLTSFDLADIPVPTGREEEWRFSPADRLQPLFQAELGASGVTVEVTAAPEVTVEIVARDDARLGTAGRPGDRTAVTAWNAFEQATIVTVPKEAVASDVTSVRVRGVSQDPTATHLLVRAERHSEAVVVLDHDGVGTLAETVEIVVEDGAQLTVVSVQDWAASGATRSSSTWS